MKRRLTREGAKRLGERERAVGLEPADEAARWLAENDPRAQPEPPKTSLKSKNLHRWRQRKS